MSQADDDSIRVYKRSIDCTSSDVPTNTMIGHQVVIGDDVIIGDNVIIDDGCTIGDDVVIDDNVVIGCLTNIGDGARVGKIACLGYGAEVGGNLIVFDDETIPAYQILAKLENGSRWPQPKHPELS